MDVLGAPASIHYRHSMPSKSFYRNHRNKLNRCINVMHQAGSVNQSPHWQLPDGLTYDFSHSWWCESNICSVETVFQFGFCCHFLGWWHGILYSQDAGQGQWAAVPGQMWSQEWSTVWCLCWQAIVFGRWHRLKCISICDSVNFYQLFQVPSFQQLSAWGLLGSDWATMVVSSLLMPVFWLLLLLDPLIKLLSIQAHTRFFFFFTEFIRMLSNIKHVKMHQDPII